MRLQLLKFSKLQFLKKFENENLESGLKNGNKLLLDEEIDCFIVERIIVKREEGRMS